MSRAVRFQQVRPVWLEADYSSGSCVRLAVSQWLAALGQHEVMIDSIVKRHKLDRHGVARAEYKSALFRWGAREHELGTARSVDDAVRTAQERHTGLPVMVESQGHIATVTSGADGPVLLDFFDSRDAKIKRIWTYVGPNNR